jgi:hypothetical protein
VTSYVPAEVSDETIIVKVLANVGFPLVGLKDVLIPDGAEALRVTV